MRHVLYVLFLSFSISHASYAQNLLTNPGFDRDLGGWTSFAAIRPPTSSAQASVRWDTSDASGSIASGSAALRTLAPAHMLIGEATLQQCVALPAGANFVNAGARVRTVRQWGGALQVRAEFSDAADCSAPTYGTSFFALPIAPGETSSQGAWLPVSAPALVPPGSKSLLFTFWASAGAGKLYGKAYIDADVDDAFVEVRSVETSTWIIPSVAHANGASGSFWKSDVILANPGLTEAVVFLRFLWHDIDGRYRLERAISIGPGRTVLVKDVLEDLFGLPSSSGDYFGGLLVRSTSSALVVRSETSTYVVAGGGFVGESLPASGPPDLIREAPRTLVPVREDPLSRTNLILVNATERPLTVDVKLFDAEGVQLGWAEVSLLPLGMTQIDRVVKKLGVDILSVGRLQLSTPMAGGAFAAYASVIDNTTNDPRAILPR
jgi:hypothetical protein